MQRQEDADPSRDRNSRPPKRRCWFAHRHRSAPSRPFPVTAPLRPRSPRSRTVRATRCRTAAPAAAGPSGSAGTPPPTTPSPWIRSPTSACCPCCSAYRRSGWSCAPRSGRWRVRSAFAEHRRRSSGIQLSTPRRHRRYRRPSGSHLRTRWAWAVGPASSFRHPSAWPAPGTPASCRSAPAHSPPPSRSRLPSTRRSGRCSWDWCPRAPARSAKERPSRSDRRNAPSGCGGRRGWRRTRHRRPTGQKAITSEMPLKLLPPPLPPTDGSVPSANDPQVGAADASPVVAAARVPEPAAEASTTSTAAARATQPTRAARRHPPAANPDRRLRNGSSPSPSATERHATPASDTSGLNVHSMRLRRPRVVAWDWSGWRLAGTRPTATPPPRCGRAVNEAVARARPLSPGSEASVTGLHRGGSERDAYDSRTR